MTFSIYNTQFVPWRAYMSYQSFYFVLVLSLVIKPIIYIALCCSINSLKRIAKIPNKDDETFIKKNIKNDIFILFNMKFKIYNKYIQN
jgi:hypothetical protein